MTVEPTADDAELARRIAATETLMRAAGLVPEAFWPVDEDDDEQEQR
ncbi:hypothetical protein [Blastococcus brunescens]|uniref:Uncharacterized protein n=1 Tax=Blastococcus brunescens TaxID=1564165 RepID=A0ABZ1AV12_9ACTN|nr:hypothetical protein [Blastococcus sp. BMG 8361]WRL62409.1 hypothetical protein U6N30_20615 [Blastococcus sp. BMG 8361]